MLGLCLGVWAGPSGAGTVTSAIAGTFNAPQENGCLGVAATYFNIDCAYTRRLATLSDRPVPWVGPTISSVYFPVGSEHARPDVTPQAGDDRMAPTLSGSVTVDDRGTREVADDRIGAVFSIGPGARSTQTRGGRGAPLTRVIESWTRVTHTMEATRVNTATRNPRGGWDYVIAARGWPTLLCAQNAASGCYPNAGAPAMAEGKWGAEFWAAPTAIGIARSPALDANPGARTTAVIDGYQCQESAPGDACTTGVGLWGTPPRHGLSNLLLKVSTDSQQRVREMTGYWTLEYRVKASGPGVSGGDGEDNSWMGGYLHAASATATSSP